jgi:hypothetical protein
MIGEKMFKKILIIGTLFSFISIGAYAQEKKETLILSTLFVTTPINCAPSKKAESTFLKKDIAFLGLIDQNNIFKIYINEDGMWSAMLENTGGLACIYFSGMAATVTKDETKPKDSNLDSLMKNKLKKDTKWSKING